MPMYKKDNLRTRLQSAIIHIFGGVLLEKLEPQQSTPDDLNQPYLFNFRKGYSGGWGGNAANLTISSGTSTTVISRGKASKEKESEIDSRYIPVKPIDVLNELEVVPTPFSVELLDEKIAMLKDKTELIKNSSAKREVSALIERLENRKKYAEYRKFFERFQNTTDEKVQALLEAHKTLVMHESDIFIPEFPDEAIKIMKEYTKNVKAITTKEPVYYVIAPDDQFRKQNEKHDPILLVQSPFGFFYQILGAWDKELIALQEL